MILIDLPKNRELDKDGQVYNDRGEQLLNSAVVLYLDIYLICNEMQEKYHRFGGIFYWNDAATSFLGAAIRIAVNSRVP